MITKASFVGFFSQGKVIFATIAAVVTFSITVYNQFKSVPKTEISGMVSSENTETKQNEYVDASDGRRDIYVLFNSGQDTEKIYAPLGKIMTPAYARRVPNVMRVIQQFHIPRKKLH